MDAVLTSVLGVEPVLLLLNKGANHDSERLRFQCAFGQSFCEVQDLKMEQAVSRRNMLAGSLFSRSAKA